eukprot:TCALIF_14168-PA protein Name:"Similar to MIMI_L437 Uncharacterized protein L437 (Acanthamoeba polyphaga mimivirus)" AED:0.03 eAED:0.03 QI:0/-1/0/1/-1/1/1/0/212
MEDDNAGASVIEIDQFDAGTMLPPNGIVFIIGKRGSGKSTVAEDIMSNFTHMREGICVSKTDKMNGFWTKHLPPQFIFHDYSSDITRRLIRHQEKKWMKHKKKCEAEGVEPQTSDIEPCFAIFDDVTFDKSFLRDAVTRELFMNGRHYNITVIITCQYLMDLGPDLRQQIDVVIVLKDNVRNNRWKLFEYFSSALNNFFVFDRVFLECTDDR